MEIMLMSSREGPGSAPSKDTWTPKAEGKRVKFKVCEKQQVQRAFSPSFFFFFFWKTEK